MKKLSIIIMLALTPSLFAQDRDSREERRSRFSEGFYVLVGATSGPSFSEFFDYINTTFQPPNKPKEFGSNVSVSLGYISRFHKNFAADIGFSIYGLDTEFDFPNPNSTIPESRISHELDYQSAIFTGTIPILFEFSPRQPVIPYVGIGLSVFSMRLDHYRDVSDGTGITSFALRDTRTAVGGHFEAGIAYKITPRLWLDLRGRWHNGTGHIATLERNFADFSIKQNISQYHAGINYYFR